MCCKWRLRGCTQQTLHDAAYHVVFTLLVPPGCGSDRNSSNIPPVVRVGIGSHRVPSELICLCCPAYQPGGISGLISFGFALCCCSPRRHLEPSIWLAFYCRGLRLRDGPNTTQTHRSADPQLLSVIFPTHLEAKPDHRPSGRSAYPCHSIPFLIYSKL